MKPDHEPSFENAGEGRGRKRKRWPKVILSFLGKACLVLLLLLALVSAGSYAWNRIALGRDLRLLEGRGVANLVDIGGRRLNVCVRGPAEAPTRLVFMPGLGVSDAAIAMKPLYSLLEDEYAVAIVDRAGYGLSEGAGDARGIADIVDEQRAALLAAGFHPPYVLVAHSIAGMYSIYWAGTHPSEVSALVLLDAGSPEFYVEEGETHAGFEDRFFVAAFDLGFQRLLGKELGLFETERMRAFPADEVVMLRALTLANPYSASMMREKSACYSNAVACLAQGTDGRTPKLAIVADMFGEDFPARRRAELLPQFRTEAEFEAFRERYEGDVARNRGYLSRLGKVRVETVASGHALFLDAPEEVAALMRSFLSSGGMPPLDGSSDRGRKEAEGQARTRLDANSAKTAITIAATN